MRDLDRLFRPESIAVIGGGAWCASVVNQCLKMGFEGALWPVHPKKTDVAGVKAYSDLTALPDVPDAVFIGVNRNLTIEMVRSLREMGAGGAVCFASGFLEAQSETGDGADLQQALLEAAGEMPILGPNCYGVINYLDGALLWPDQHGGRRVERGVAVVMQSSNMAINVTMQARALPLAYVATVGNQAQTGLSDVGLALLRDPRVTTLGLHIEGIDDLTAFETLAREARGLGKRIVALKAGKSAQAQAAAISHTASLAGSDAGARALLKRLGIAQVESLPAWLESLKLLHCAGPLASNRVVSMSCSGGEASLMADSAEARSISFPALSDAQVKSLRKALGPMVALSNPLDYHTFIWNDVARMAEVFTAMLKGRVDIGCIIVDFPRADLCDPGAWDCVIEAGASAAQEVQKPLALVATLPEAMSEDVAQRIVNGGMVPMHGLDDALSAIEVASLSEVPDASPVTQPGAPVEPRVLSEAQAKATLASYGLVVPNAITADTPAEAAAACKALTCPVVLKGTGVAHKTEAGFVALNLTTPKAVEDAATDMRCDGFLVEEMATGAVAELLIGVLRDPAHGFVLTLGAGGTLTEILADSVSLLLPVTEREIVDALQDLRVAPILNGYRGKAGCDLNKAAKAVLAVQDYVTDHAAQLEEVEINPLICTETDAIAVDALIRIGEAS
ncbi:acetate--CoA ligase family protein [Roseovarius rhodophyticola]|uniref:Acetate--CoA ligase family protein n=1 Tax=Roseovarius rhodophyticola TaxID=3080827 RepID=A0ABZ2TGB2_9RHOB|nr:acetate--CoA ligase family protein [Roseovarius sp. W115]MDV2929027.1 acetate--CoA ligase family protein [Roseovarius sp. W115]